jgi:hypothetical protein
VLTRVSARFTSRFCRSHHPHQRSDPLVAFARSAVDLDFAGFLVFPRSAGASSSRLSGQANVSGASAVTYVWRTPSRALRPSQRGTRDAYPSKGPPAGAILGTLRRALRGRTAACPPWVAASPDLLGSKRSGLVYLAVCELRLRGGRREESLEPLSRERSRVGEGQEPELLAA